MSSSFSVKTALVESPEVNKAAAPNEKEEPVKKVVPEKEGEAGGEKEKENKDTALKNTEKRLVRFKACINKVVQMTILQVIMLHVFFGILRSYPIKSSISHQVRV